MMDADPQHAMHDAINQFLSPVHAFLNDPAKLENTDDLRTALSNANMLIARLISDRNVLLHAVVKASKEMTVALTLHEAGDLAGLVAHLDEVLADVNRLSASRRQAH